MVARHLGANFFLEKLILSISFHCTGTGAGTDIRTAQKSLYSTGTAHASKAIVRLFTTS